MADAELGCITKDKPDEQQINMPGQMILKLDDMAEPKTTTLKVLNKDAKELYVIVPNCTTATDQSSEFLANSSEVMQVFDQSESEQTLLFPSVSGNSNDLCLICGDNASGFHYSTLSCEGCKGFFKRSVQKNLTYCCKEAGTCLITKVSRNCCQSCRFEKCLSMGMKREAVREDRTPGGKHRHKRLRVEERLDATSEPEVVLRGSLVDLEEDFLRDSLVAAKPHLYPKGDNPQDFNENVSVNDLMQYGYLELRFIIDWAKKVPEFAELQVPDQMALLKSSFMELNVLRLSFRSMHLSNQIKFSESIILPLDYCEKIGWGKELVDGTVDFAQRLKDIGLDITEFCILNAIVLLFPDAHGLQDKVRIHIMQSKMLDCLRRYISYRYPQEIRRFGKILLRLPALRMVSAKAAERFLSLTYDGNIQLNELVLEMMN